MASTEPQNHTAAAASSSQPQPSNSSQDTTAAQAGKKKKRHRAGKNRRKRRQSFAAPSETSEAPESDIHIPSLLDVPEEVARTAPFQRINQHRRASNTSIESEALLDHRGIPHGRTRRPSTGAASRPSQPRIQSSHSKHQSSSRTMFGRGDSSSYQRYSPEEYDENSMDEDTSNDKTPLIPSRATTTSRGNGGAYGAISESLSTIKPTARHRRESGASSGSNVQRKPFLNRQQSTHSIPELNEYSGSYDVNNPPSQPNSPRLGPNDDFDDVLLPQFQPTGSDATRNAPGSRGRDAIIDIDAGAGEPARPHEGSPTMHRRSIAPVEMEDVCLPFDRMTEVGEEDFLHHEDVDSQKIRRGRKRPWPDLSALEEWSRDEKEARTMEGVRAKKVNEPVLVGGRLRPSRQVWRREEEDAPFRWTYFNEELDSSLRSHTISGLQQLGLSFQELFIPDPPLLEDSSDDDDDDYSIPPDRSGTPINGRVTRQTSVLTQPPESNKLSSGEQTGRNTPINGYNEKPKRYGPRPVFWLDVLQPTYEEMRVISRAFGIHKLTAEDIMEQEAREKVELFRNYYFVNYRTFEQDPNSDEHMDAINMYFVVFKGGVLSFHFSQMPHPPNVRRRIRQLAEHQYTDSDWIAYAIIDNITDAYAPIVEQIETEVDDIDEQILRLHSKDSNDDIPDEKSPAWKKAHKLLFKGPSDNKSTNGEGGLSGEQSRDILMRVGECRKKVMGLYRLLGNKADVIKGLAKRCNEQWQVAPRSDVGLYLGDIQDHIVTMTANLSHYESILSRAHSNYLAQINIRMTERGEQTNDVLNKLTVLGTIVLPMNIITGMWGMNVMVPGQEVENLHWFWAITAGLVMFGFSCFFIAKRFYHVV